MHDKGQIPLCYAGRRSGLPPGLLPGLQPGLRPGYRNEFGLNSPYLGNSTRCGHSYNFIDAIM